MILIPAMTVGEAVKLLKPGTPFISDEPLITDPLTFGQLLELANNSPVVQGQRDREIPIDTTVGTLLDMVGEDKVELYIKQKTAEAGRKDAYESTPWNLVENWFFLGGFILLFALMSVISLELIDRDKR